MEGRDEAAEGLFVYAVRTTGVFCRPGCRSRRPLRANVEYFDTPGDALSAGYRACRRCRPDQERASDATTAALVAACRRFELDADESVVQVAREVGLSERHLRRLFTEVVGVPAGSYRRACREKRLRDALRGGSDVTTAAVESGYGSARALYDGARLGMTPGRYRDGGRGERIRFTSIVTPLGVVVAASSSRGVCWVSVGPREADLTKALAAEYPLAVLERDDDALADVARTLSLAASGADASRLPLDVQGTAFQIRVWEALREIPVGETRTYSEVAAFIGEPRAVRAVASACAANVAALAIPCHRVVRRDGTLGGYRWGIDVKRSLLAAESGE